MVYNRMMSELDATRAQLAIFAMIILLAVDSVNPVKIFLHVFPQVAPWHLASISALIILYIFISELKELLYFGVKVYFHVLLSIFFKEVEVIGRDNIPPYGPVIFTGNHANQFVDALMLMCTCQHKLSHMIAEKSWKRPVVGHLAWAMGCVPVKRAQDSAKPGTGKIQPKRQFEPMETSNADDTDDNNTKEYPMIEVAGIGTKFTSEIGAGDKIRFSGNTGLKVVKVENDELLFLEENEVTMAFVLSEEPTSFEILKRVDQSIVYGAVLDTLHAEGTIGMFPEGGSHDRTDLLPLKVGVSLIAYSAMVRDGLSIPIVPVGLSYYRGHRFRGRAVVEYGSPIYIDPSTVEAYKAGGAEKRKVANEFLQKVADSMRSVIVTTPDYETYSLVHTARRLFQRRIYSASQKQDLNRRFAEGYKRLVLQAKGNPPPEWLAIQKRLLDYQNELSELGIRDYQVGILGRKQNQSEGDYVLNEMRIPFRILRVLFTIILTILPTLVLNLPVGGLARIYAEKKRKKALAGSKVKIHGRDVMMSERIIFCIVMVPTLWFIYGLLLVLFTNLDGPSITLAYFSMPLFSYMGVMSAESGLIDLKDLRPHVMRLLPSTRRRLQALPAIRRNLQRDLRKFVREVGPALGEVYYDKELDWKLIQERSRIMREEGTVPVSPPRADKNSTKED